MVLSGSKGIERAVRAALTSSPRNLVSHPEIAP